MFHAAIDEACNKPDESNYKVTSDDVDWDDWENWDQLGTVDGKNTKAA